MKTELRTKSDVLYYWQGVADPKKLLAGENGSKIAKALKQVFDGNTMSADLDLKRAKGYRIYGIRLNDADRVLFTTVEVEGQAHVLLLDLIQNHDYRKSLALKPTALKNFLKKHEGHYQIQVIDRALEESDFETIEQLPEAFSVAVPDFSKNTPLYHQPAGFIAFSRQQKQALKEQFPLVVRGSAGSGKSCIAQAVFAEQLSALLASSETLKGGHFKVLFSAKSSHLIEKTADFWYGSPQAEKFETIEIAFKPYHTFAAAAAGLDEDKKCPGFEAFAKWLTAGKDKKEKKALPQKNEAWIDSAQLIYNELKILAFCKEKAYFELGLRESRASKNPTQQAYIVSLFDEYLAYLDSEGKIDPALKLIQAEQYDFVVVDEGQDFAPLEIQSLLLSAKNQRICLCIDTNQTLTNSAPDLNFIYTLPGVSLVDLTASYRLPQSIAQLATDVLHLKNFLCKGVLHKGDYVDLVSAHSEKGFVEFFTQKALTEDLIKLAKSPEVAVIIPELACYEEAYQLFHTPLIFTPDEIKGDEFPYIIAYKLFDGKKLKPLNQIVSKWYIEDGLNKREISTHRSKEKEKQFEHEAEVNLLNQLFVALTRSTKGLYVVNEGNKNHALLQHFQKREVTAQGKVSVDESDKAWEEAIKKRDNESYSSDLVKERLISHYRNKQQLNQKGVNQDKAINQPEHSQKNASYKKEAIKAEKKETKKEKNLVGKNADDAWVKYIASFAALENMNVDAIQHNLNTLYRNKNFGRVFFELRYKNKILFEHLFEQDLGREALVTWVYRLSRDGNCGQFMEGFNPHAKFASQYRRHDHKRETRSAIEALTILSCAETEIFFKNNAELFFSLQGNKTGFNLVLPKQTAIEPQDLYSFVIEENISLFYLISRAAFTFENFMKAYPRFLAPNYTNALSKALCTPYQVSQATALWELSQFSENFEALNYLLNKNPDLGATITPDAFYRYHPVKSKSVFFWLAISVEHGLLQRLWRQNEALRSAITAKDLYTIWTKNNTSAFYGLTRTRQGRALLTACFEDNEKLIEALTVETLYRNYEGDDTSAFYWLTVDEEGRALLNTLTQKNQALLNAMTGEILSKTCLSDHTSPLYWLVSTEKGIAFINDLLEKNPTLLKGICSLALCGHLVEDKMNVFHWLTSFKNGSLLLKKILDQNEGILAEITPQALYSVHPIHRTSAFFWLVMLSVNAEILIKLFETNKSLFQEVTTEALYSLNVKNTSAFYWLVSTHNGRVFLGKLLVNNPILVEGVTPEALYTIYPLVNTAAFYWLAANADYYRLLATLWEWEPMLVKAVTPEALCNTYVMENTSAFYWLAKLLITPEEGSLLKNLLAMNPDLLMHINLDTLTALNKADNTSSLYWLAASIKGRAILIQWCDKHEASLIEMTPEALYTQCTTDNTSVFYKLVESQKGIEILNRFLAKKPELLTALTWEALCSADTTSNQSPLDLLVAMKSEGYAMLEKILTNDSALNDPRIVDAINTALKTKLSVIEQGVNNSSIEGSSHHSFFAVKTTSPSKVQEQLSELSLSEDEFVAQHQP